MERRDQEDLLAFQVRQEGQASEVKVVSKVEWAIRVGKDRPESRAFLASAFPATEAIPVCRGSEEFRDLRA